MLAAIRAGLCALLAPLSPMVAQISPGELSRAHAKLDGSDGCLQCHSAASGVDHGRCLACHTPLAQRIHARRGLHSRPDHGDCERCHIEHQGRAFDLVYWGKSGERSFDHELTGYSLQGAHAPLGCRSCHRKESIADPAPLLAKQVDLGRTFLGLEARCASCHADVHRGQFGATDCAACHGSKKFKPAESFDHSRAKFPLTHGHAKVECSKCHPVGLAPAGTPAAPADAPPYIAYRGVATTCAGCHKDPHQGRFGAKCESCHTADDWKRIQTANFDHSRTRYPLTGRHVTTACATCHPPGKTTKLPGFERCATCHADAHAGQLVLRKSGGECGECHTTAGFRGSSFTVALHEATAYPLAGTHRRTDCAACHRALPPAELERAGVALIRGGTPPKAGLPGKVTQFRFPKADCADCHRDPHAGASARSSGEDGCLACHALTEWREIRFDHARTRFPITGLHGKVTCLGCHPTKLSGGLLPAPAARAWAPPREVPLAGAPLVCSGCHADPHLAQVGAACERCHTDSSWAPSRFLHDRDSTYRLEGAHRAVACVACHFKERISGKEVARLKPLGSACADCHKSAVLPL